MSGISCGRNCDDEVRGDDVRCGSRQQQDRQAVNDLRRYLATWPFVQIDLSDEHWECREIFLNVL